LAGSAGAATAAISMALGNYISVKSQREVYHAQIETEKREMHEMPDIEREEVRQIYRKKGFRGKQLDSVVRHLTADKKRWLEVMVEEELGIRTADLENPIQSGLLTGGAFTLAALFPIAPFIFLPAHLALPMAITLTLLAAFSVGIIKTKYTRRPWLQSGLEMVLICGISSALGFFVGRVLGSGF
ncbi:MAG: VIT1/CCC1 transporter family protein, partial [Candidatus Micrarchaeota archaeon]|nr:VIT1/CCC1 transporter family protein [Candidatus Micrarchaeota archaeon]